MRHHALVSIPSEDASELEWLRFAQAGVVTWRQATTLLSPGKVRHLVATGRWRRLCRGLLVTFTGPIGRPQQLWAAVLGAGPGAVLAGLRRDAVDVLLPAGRRAPDLLRRLPPELPAVFVHRTTHLPEDDRQLGRPTRTSMPRSLVDAAQWAATDDQARIVIAAGCQQRLVLPEEILEVLPRMPTVRRRRLIRQTAHDAAGGAESLAEIDLGRLCRRFGLPEPLRQVRRKDATGRVRYLDAYWPEFGLHVEIDGAHHLEVGEWEADMRRQNAIWVRGDRLLRFPAFQLRRRPAVVAGQIRDALLTAGWRP